MANSSQDIYTDDFEKEVLKFTAGNPEVILCSCNIYKLPHMYIVD